MQPEHEKKATPDFVQNVLDFAELFIIAAAAILLLFTLVIRPSVVEGTSMQNTLQPNDRMLISALFYTPKNGDIVVVQSPTVDGGKAIIKRVIATGGQTVQIKEDGIYVYDSDGSGGKLEEEDGSLGYTVSFYDPYTGRDLKNYSNATVTVPEGQVFVLGDHRTVSYDSRYFGCVDERCIIGRAVLRLAPLSSFGTVR